MSPNHSAGKRKCVAFLSIFLPVLLHLILCMMFSRANYLTVDEPVHIVGGLEILRNANHNINPESGVLPQAAAALPLIWKADVPEPMTMERMLTTPYPYARYVLFEINHWNDISCYLLSRLCMCSFSVICIVFLWLAVKRACGAVPAGFMALIYAVLPMYVSNAPLTTADMASAAFFITSVFTCVNLFRVCGLRNWLWFTASCACLILSKFSGVSIAPVLFALLICAACSKSRFILRIPFRAERPLTSKRSRFAAGFIAMCLTLIAVYGIIWTVYGFRADFPEVPEKSLAVRDYQSFADNSRGGAVPDIMKFCGNHKILPRVFVYGFLHTYHYAQKRWSYLNGKTSMYGFRSFFPLTFLYKTPICAVLALLTGFILYCAEFLRGGPMMKTRAKMLFPYILFGVFFGIAALFSRLNIGYRHLMPSLTALLPLTAFGVRVILRRAETLGGWRQTAMKAVPVILALGTAADSCWGTPFFLSYFSPVFGGRGAAVRHICDSSLDWGQDIIHIRGELEKRNIPADGSVPIYLNYFGSVPESLQNLPHAHLHPYGNDTEDVRTLLYDFLPGWYLISATHLHGYQRSPAFEKLFANPGAMAEFIHVYYGALDFGLRPDAKNYEHAVLEIRNIQALRHEILRRSIEKIRPRFSINHSIYAYYLNEKELRHVFRDLRRPYPEK